MAHDNQGSIYLIENSVKNIIHIVKHLLQFKISVSILMYLKMLFVPVIQR